MRSPIENFYAKKNTGYTLVELIIVIAITATMIGLLSLGISILFSRDSEKVAKFIDEYITEVRTSAMSRPGEFSIIIHTTESGNGNYIEIEKSELNLVKPTPVVPGDPVTTPAPVTPTKTRVDIDDDAYIVFGKQGSLPADASDGEIKISFDKANGSVTGIDDNGTVYSGSGLDDVFEIKCTGVRNTTRSSSILLMPVTGRHSVE